MIAKHYGRFLAQDKAATCRQGSRSGLGKLLGGASAIVTLGDKFAPDWLHRHGASPQGFRGFESLPLRHGFKPDPQLFFRQRTSFIALIRGRYANKTTR